MIQYLDLIRKVRNEGTYPDSSKRTASTYLSLFGTMTKYDVSESFPLLTTKKLPLRLIFEELRWFLAGSTDEKELASANVNIWAEWATPAMTSKFGRLAGDLGPTYGYQWRSFGGNYPQKDGFDQIKYLISEIQRAPASRRLILNSYHAKQATEVELPPCHTMAQFDVRDGVLNCMMTQRSADLFLGVPFNVASYALLMEMIAHVTGLKAGTLTHSIGNAHIYENHLSQVEEQLSRTPRQTPTLQIVNADDYRGLEGLLSFSWDNIVLNGYEPNKRISAPVSV